MVSVKITPGKLSGHIVIPTSKSHTIRSLLFALMAKGKSRLHHPLPSPDTVAMIEAVRRFGGRVDMEKEALIVDGVGGKLQPPDDVIQCGNSGQVLRFMGALAALLPSYTVFTGDLSLRHNRPVRPLLDALQQMGVFAESSRLDGFAPIVVRGPLQTGRARLEGKDSQPVSGLLMLGAFHSVELEVENPGERPWIDLTLSWLDRFGIRYETSDYRHYKVKAGSIPGFEYVVPGDFSSAAFPIAAALVTQKEMTIDRLDANDVQGDKEILDVLTEMGAQFEWHGTRLVVKKGGALRGQMIDVNRFIDALPILAVVGCFAEGETTLTNGAIARSKESDRIRCIVKELKKMGAQIEERGDGLVVRSSRLKGAANLEAHDDHRIAMALTVAALGAQGDSVIHGVECVAKSYPGFFRDLLILT